MNIRKRTRRFVVVLTLVVLVLAASACSAPASPVSLRGFDEEEDVALMSLYQHLGIQRWSVSLSQQLASSYSSAEIVYVLDGEEDTVLSLGLADIGEDCGGILEVLFQGERHMIDEPDEPRIVSMYFLELECSESKGGTTKRFVQSEFDREFLNSMYYTFDYYRLDGEEGHEWQEGVALMGTVGYPASTSPERLLLRFVK